MTAEAIADLRDLARRYFVLQEERPDGIEEVEVGKLEPFLRSLLFTDGTVTRALAVQMLASISVRPLSQRDIAVSGEVAGYLETEAGTASIRRRVSIGAGATTLLWAESHLLPDRLPPCFFGELEDASDGIGQSLQQASLENYRELLWFGLDAMPEWAPPAKGDATIRRLYRLVNDRRASILISESFPVEWRSGALRLVGLDSAPAVPRGAR